MVKDSRNQYPIITDLVVKLASRCNINCQYCYWFNDPLVMQSPKFLLPEVVDVFLLKLHKHIQKYQLASFQISFHGGEPTLFPKTRFREFCQALRDIEQKTGCQIHFSMQSNGLLIDDDWIELLKTFHVNLGVSLDSTKHLHDKNRVDFKGKGTYQKTLNSITKLASRGVNAYVLSVAAPENDVQELVEHFINQLNLKDFDVLIPHFHHQHDEKPSIGKYYCDLFDFYIGQLIQQDVSIRLLDGFMSQVVGANSGDQGYGYISTATLLTDGKLESTDDLRMIDGLETGDIFIQTHELQQVTEDPLWQEVYRSSLQLADECERCQYKKMCGGGPMVSRWSQRKRFNNPSIYCEDFKILIDHIQQRLKPHLENISYPLFEASA